MLGAVAGKFLIVTTSGCHAHQQRQSITIIVGGIYADVVGAMGNMCAAGRIIEPQKSSHITEYHNAKYEIFLSMYEHELLYRAKMQKFV